MSVLNLCLVVKSAGRNIFLDRLLMVFYTAFKGEKSRSDYVYVKDYKRYSLYKKVSPELIKEIEENGISPDEFEMILESILKDFRCKKFRVFVYEKEDYFFVERFLGFNKIRKFVEDVVELKSVEIVLFGEKIINKVMKPEDKLKTIEQIVKELM